MQKRIGWNSIGMRFAQKAIIAALVSVPVTVWAPNELVKSDILEIRIHYQVLSNQRGTGADYLSASQAKEVTDFLNRQFENRGIRFFHSYDNAIDEANADFAKLRTKREALAAAEKFSKSGEITIVVPMRANFSAAYLGQSLESGPIALYDGKSGKVGIAHEIGHIFGFTDICEAGSNIMYRDCPASRGADVKTVDWAYFTADDESQYFQQALDLWKWDAQNFLVTRTREGARGGTFATTDLTTETQSTP